MGAIEDKTKEVAATLTELSCQLAKIMVVEVGGNMKYARSCECTRCHTGFMVTRCPTIVNGENLCRTCVRKEADKVAAELDRLMPLCHYE